MYEPHVDRQRSWRNGWTQGPYVTVVVFGRLGDGRWFAERHGRLADDVDRRRGACAFDAHENGRILALRLAYRWMRESGVDWTAMPASFDSDGNPADGLPWIRRGSDWILDPPRTTEL
jgi:hypothetical protein